MPFDFACSFFGVIGRVVSPVSSFLLLPVFSARAFFVREQACWLLAEASGVAGARRAGLRASERARSDWVRGDLVQGDSAGLRAGGFAALAELADSPGYFRGDWLRDGCSPGDFAEDCFLDGYWAAAPDDLAAWPEDDSIPQERADDSEPVDLALAGSEPADLDGLAAGSRAVRGGR